MKPLSKKESKKEVKKEEHKKEEPKEVVETQKRTISDEAAKNSVVSNDMIARRLPGESLSVWKHRVGLSKEEPKKPKKIK